MFFEGYFQVVGNALLVFFPDTPTKTALKEVVKIVTQELKSLLDKQVITQMKMIGFIVKYKNIL
jgi:hypothetical protein